MRKASIPLHTQLSEPLIVVEESGYPECDDSPGGRSEKSTPGDSSGGEQSPTMLMNPYLLSPYRDTRKHSLPTPQCSGITASQVRRLSERENAIPGPKQTEFLATLSTAPTPAPGGRRHSVVTISKIPSTLFGRNRRESIACPSRVLASRRESITGGPPSTEPHGSVHNLQLDIMDDIVQARKVRMKLWTTSSEKVCEVQPLDETGGVQRYTHSSARRYSDFVGTTLAPIPSGAAGSAAMSRRRASELPPPPMGAVGEGGPSSAASGAAGSSSSNPLGAGAAGKIEHMQHYYHQQHAADAPGCSSSSRAAGRAPAAGIVCTNTDLISILSSVTTATSTTDLLAAASASTSPLGAQYEDRAKIPDSPSATTSPAASTTTSVQIEPIPEEYQRRMTPSTPASSPQSGEPGGSITVAPTRKDPGDKESVLWDGRSGSLVDAHVLGSAIEGFLATQKQDTTGANTSGDGDGAGVSSNKSQGAIPKTTSSSNSKPLKSWFSSKSGDGRDENQEVESREGSLCSTLKDLFVK